MNEYDKFYNLLDTTLLEIRAARNLRDAQQLADIVHNLPISLSVRRSTAEIEEHLTMRAERLGMTSWLEKRLNGRGSRQTGS